MQITKVNYLLGEGRFLSYKFWYVIARNEAISMQYRAVLNIVERSIAAKAVTFVATKVTKKAVSREASLPH